MKNYLLETKTEISKPLDQVFDFFSRAENLEKLTPKWLNFKILTPLPIEIRQGKIIDYEIRLFGIPFKWKTLITDWQPGIKFTDEQLKGPYKTWIHTHHFEAVGSKTVMRDRVEYRPKGGILSPIIHYFFVKKQVKKIFDFRRAMIVTYFRES